MRPALIRALACSSVLWALASGCDSNPDAPSAPAPTGPSTSGAKKSKVERSTRQVAPPLGTTPP